MKFDEINKEKVQELREGKVVKHDSLWARSI